MSAEADPRKLYRWRTVTFWLFVLVVLGGMGVVGHFWYQRDEAQRQLHRVIAELDRDDPGWRFADLQVARQTIPDAENGALVVISVGGKLPNNWPPSLIEEALIKPAPNEKLSEEVFRAIG